MPDVFTAWDSTPITDYYLDLRRKNVINLFVGDYVDQNRTSLQKNYPDFKSFNQDFQVNEAFMNDFFALAEKDSVKKDEKQYLLSERLIKSQLKALIAQKLWDVTAFFNVVNQNDDEVIKAVEVIGNDGMFRKYQIQP